MKLKIALATATAMGVLMGGAWAQSVGDRNETKIEQTGDENDVRVKQSGSDNVAGMDRQSAPSAVLRQTGDSNTIDIEQTGDRNRVGGNHGGTFGAHQTGDHNYLKIEQETKAAGGSTNGNTVQGVRQDSSGSATALTNSATVTQGRPTGGSMNATHFVGLIDQDHTGGAVNTIVIEQTGEQSGWYGGQPYSGQSSGNKVQTARQNGSGNSLDVTQDGMGILGGYNNAQMTGPNNEVGMASQLGDSNTATVTQSGYNNFINRMAQDSTGEATGNTVMVSITGTSNGRASLEGGALASGATSSEILQTGAGNDVKLTITADNNRFGITQTGDRNEVGEITITGNDNQVGVNQLGNDNALGLSTVSGMGNEIGVKQTGDFNLATVNISGSFNGDGSAAFGGPAAEAAAGRQSGLIEQISPTGTLLADRNSVSLNISTDTNQFSLYQNGQQNTIMGTVNTGGMNQVAVAQVGNDNAASFVQSGQGNNIGISQ